MLWSYLLLAWRSLVRQKAYALINVVGLAIGVAGSLLAFALVYHEWSYDRFHDHAEGIYLVRYEYADEDRPMVFTPPVLAPTLVSEAAGFRRVGRIYWGRDLPVVPDGGRALTLRGVFADPDAFRLFSFPPVAGDPAAALEGLDGMVLSREAAARLFGDGDPLARRVSVSWQGRQPQDFAVAGVVDVPSHSSITFDFAIPHAVRGDFADGNWGQCHVLTFVELPPEMGPQQAEQVLNRIADRHIPQSLRDGFGGSGIDGLRLLPLVQMHFTTGLRDIPRALDPAYCVLLAGIALAVLAIACINYVNLALALLSRRVREVGIRKTSGATRTQLVRQFLAESALMALFSVGLGLALAELLWPTFSRLVGTPLTRQLAPSLVATAVLALAIGLVTGGYPALALSRFQPVEVLRGRLRFSGPTLVGRGLVTLQFACSVLFVVIAAIMSRQVEHLRSRDLGFDADRVLVLDLFQAQPEGPDDFLSLLDGLHDLVRQQPGILAMGAASNPFLTDGLQGTTLHVGGVEAHTRVYHMDEGFLPTLGIDLLAGRPLDAARGTDADEAMLVNEAFVGTFALAQAVGLAAPDPDREGHEMTIVGVVADFQARPLRYPVEPAVFKLAREPWEARYLYLRLAPERVRASLDQVEAVWAARAPGRPFAYSFLDQDVDAQLRQEGRWIPVTRWVAAVAILIANLGVLGLTALAVARRTKEIGIRKAVGASLPRIVGLLSREFTALVVVANLVAWPLAWYIASRWLEGFAYRIEVGVAPFALSGLAVLLVAWVAMGLQTVRAARANPVDALRCE